MEPGSCYAITLIGLEEKLGLGEPSMMINALAEEPFRTA